MGNTRCIQIVFLHSDTSLSSVTDLLVPRLLLIEFAGPICFYD